MPRLRYGVALRLLFVLGVFAVYLQVMVSLNSGAPDRLEGQLTSDDAASTNRSLPIIDDVMSANETSHVVLEAVPLHLRKYLTMSAHNSSTVTNATERSRNTSDILREIARYNDAQTVLNLDLYGPVRPDTVIIAVQVHTRLTYLRHLIVSLAQARGIENTLLIFSHDHFDDEINFVVQSIDFCMVMQIFYPFSIQTHPHEFPGEDPNDCPRNAQPEIARKVIKCNNAEWPDVHKHYREAKYTQTKHHWWWKAHRIFNQLDVTLNHEGLVVFLEEDHYVAKDALHMLELMKKMSGKLCPKCEMFCLGTYLKKFSYYGNTLEVELTPWLSSTHNMGMAFNKTVFRSISEHAGYFCLYDDYNWDFSLLHLSQRRGLGLTGRFQVMMSVAPRVFHIGECGFHHKKTDCNASTVISKVQRLLAAADANLFPGRLVARVTRPTPKQNKKLVTGNGGWGDLRDREFCMAMSKLGRSTNRTTVFSTGRNTLSYVTTEKKTEKANSTKSQVIIKLEARVLKKAKTGQ